MKAVFFAYFKRFLDKAETAFFCCIKASPFLTRNYFFPIKNGNMESTVGEVALRGDAHGIGRSNWAKGRDPSGSRVQYPNAATYLHTMCVFRGNFYSWQLRAVCILICRGALSHRARYGICVKSFSCSLSFHCQSFVNNIYIRKF